MAPKLEGYEFGETVARGAGAKLKKAIHIATGQTVAVKILSFKGFAKVNHGALQKFKKRGHREMFVAKHLKHPNIMTCYMGQMYKRRAYIVMEWMEGGSLDDYLAQRGGTLTEGEARRYFRQLIHGVEYCHKLLLIHRDLKPGNLLLDETKQHLKIADFGISNYLTADLTLSSYCGTNLYQAQEISKDGTNYSGPEVDIYSCGVTLYHLLFGCPSLRSFQYGRLSIPLLAPADAADLISRMTEWEPKQRITIGEIKNHRWFQGGDQMFLNDPHGISDQGIDNNILLETIKKTQCEREYLLQSLIQGEHTEETTTYKLLKKKKMQDVED